MSGNAMMTVSIVPASTSTRSRSTDSRPWACDIAIGCASPLRHHQGPTGLPEGREFRLDSGQLLRRALHLRTLEPLTGRYQPIDAGKAYDRHHGDRREVPAVDPGRVELRQHQREADDDNPHHSNPPDDRAPLTELPRTRGEVRPAHPTEQHRNDVGDVKADDCNRHDREERDGVPLVL